jgi:hypothetical protein
MNARRAALETTEAISVPHESLSASGRKSAGGVRYGFVDLLRGYALVVMIETHVINSYLPLARRNSVFNAVGEGRDARYMIHASWVALAVVGGALVARELPLFSAWRVGFYATSPLYMLIRLGCVLILCAGLYAMEKRLHWVPRAIRLAGQESLLVYGAHLLLVFSVLRRSLVASILGRQAGYGGCLLLSAVLILLMLGLARLWHGWKRDNPRFAKLILIAVVGINAIVFLLR